MLRLTDFTIEPCCSNMEAMKKIDYNTKGFLVVVKHDIVIGTLTDGDIRRAFLNGRSFDDKVEGEYNKNFKSLSINNDFTDAIELFKSNIEFLPILDDHNKLVNILMKKQLHSLLLQDIHFDLSYDFLSVDETLMDFNVYQRPWGFYKTTVLNHYFQSKIISVRPKGSLSLQLHNRREEYWVVVHGTGSVQIGESIIPVTGGSSLFIPKGCKHRITNTSENESLIMTEVQIGDYYGEDDIVRFDDLYGR